MKSMTGGAYDRIMDSAELIAAGQTKPTDLPFVSGVFINRHQRKSIGDFYDRLRELEKLKSYAEYDMATMSGAEAMELNSLNDYQSLMSDFHAAQRGLDDRDAITAGNRLIVGLAREALGKEPMEANPSPFTVPRRKWPAHLKEKRPGNDTRSVYEEAEHFIQKKIDLLNGVRRPQSGSDLEQRTARYEERAREAKNWLSAIRISRWSKKSPNVEKYHSGSTAR